MGKLSLERAPGMHTDGESGMRVVELDGVIIREFDPGLRKYTNQYGR